MAYYPVQVEKILHRYEILTKLYGEEKVRARYDKEENGILDEFLAHGKAIAAERQRAEAEGELPDFQPLVESWGGVTLFYRKGIHDAPAYRLNHEEISEALEEKALRWQSLCGQRCESNGECEKWLSVCGQIV